MMAYCEHWLFQYEKNCIGVRLWLEHGWYGGAGLVSFMAVLLLIVGLLKWRAA